MRTEAPQPRPRYRNEAVFRSAERLLASQPKKNARHSPPRALIFLLGLACGLSIAFWLLRPTSQSLTPDTNADAATVGPYVGRKRLNPPLAHAKPTSAPAAPAPVIADAPPAAAESTVAPVEKPAASTSGPRAIVIAPRPAARPPADNDHAPLGFFLKQASNLIKLRGELRDGPAGRRTVDFELYLTAGRLSGSVHGLVWLADDRVRANPFPVSGRWFDRTITLRETVKLIHGSSPPPAHSFVLEFPRYDETDAISGTWSHAGFAGKLVLRVMPPL